MRPMCGRRSKTQPKCGNSSRGGVPKTGALVRRVSDVSGKLSEREVGGGEAPSQVDLVIKLQVDTKAGASSEKDKEAEATKRQ